MPISPNDGPNSKRSLNRPLAIVGMACRLPGADGLAEFWELLRSGRSAIERMPDGKLDRSLYFDPVKGRRGKTYSEIGGFISERDVDWSALPFDKAEAANWDRSHLILCEVAAAACRNAGWDPRQLPLRNGAVFVGHSGGSTLGGELAYRILAPENVALLKSVPGLVEAVGESLGGTEQLQEALLKRVQSSRPERGDDGRPFTEAGFAAGIVSRALGLTGPHMSIDAACASSLVALALAAATLQTGQSDIAIVGGASYNKADSLILFSQAQSCSASGSRPFDEAADGLISSEGYVAIVLKTLERAEADGDRVHAVIHGIGVSSDGRGKSLWAPRKEGQYAAIGRAYSEEVTPASVQMVEAHATSTQVGDATEMEALSQFFRERCPPGQRIPVGSVKSNIGHTLETAGLAGLVKAVLSIQHGTVPPSINVRNLSKSIPWSQIPLYVPHACEAWPALEADVPRRAAVNAFGIGGLNVHVVVEQYLDKPSARTLPRVMADKQPVYLSEPVAVIGRGLVLPGAANVEQLAALLKSGWSQIGSRDGSQQVEMIEVNRFGRKRQVPMLGGHVRGFEYDWRKHKVPPKQIAQANPLQFMLLEAAEQALREGRCYEREFDRQNTAVVVGSIFGGDFGNALFAGLRLPEFKHHLTQLLQERGVSASQAAEFARAYEEKFLKINPALLDETGSFTSSTLASRLSKTFDLMGGALAIDSGDVSSFAALQAASQLLQTRAANQVLCAAAHRSLDRAAMETLAKFGCLPGTSSSGEGYYVGEGVAVVLLKRLSDAQRDGDHVWATINGIAAGFDAYSINRSLQTAAQKLPLEKSAHVIAGNGVAAHDASIAHGLSTASVKPSALVKLTGHLQATQGLAELIAATIDETVSPSQQVVLAGHTVSGQSYVVSLASKVQPTVKAIQNVSDVLVEGRAEVPSVSKSAYVSQLFRFEAESASALQSLLSKLANETPARASSMAVESYRADRAWRAAIVCESAQLNNKLALAAKQVGVAATRVPMSEQGVFWSTSDSERKTNQCRIAWLFPGQGSQYRGMLAELIASDRAAANALAVADAWLQSKGQPKFAAIVGHDAETLGEDVWLTQAAVLVADWVMMETLRSRGFEPSLVTGHSFGEFAAMLAAGCWDIAGALQATWHRCEAIVQHVPAGFAMLSIQSDAARVRDLLAQEHFGISISHINAAQQVVVGGRHAAVVEFAQLLDDAGLTSRMLAVPTAFHTPALQPAQVHFARALEGIEILPPRIPLLSSITNRYEAEPAQLSENLVQQLVRPIDFVGISERLRRDRVSLAIEVGPQQVLTRLLRQNVGDAFPAVACDQPKRASLHQLLCVQANLELHGGVQRQAKVAISSSSVVSSSKSAAVHFDATQVRRDRMRASGRGSAPSLNLPAQRQPAVVNHDATLHETLVRPIADVKPAVERPIAKQVAAPESTAALPTPASAPTTHAPKFIETFLIDFVVEQTGYPAEIIELDWDIEADLGIDSIKKAQLFGELREFFDLESLTEFSLDNFRTLRDIATLLEQTPGKTDWMEQAAASGQSVTPQTAETVRVTEFQPAASVIEPVIEQVARPEVDSANEQPSPWADEAKSEPPTVAANNANNANSANKLNLSTAQLTQFLIDFVVEQTGYPEEIVELDADLEADLGIDSIKKAQLFGELREMFQFTAQPAAAESGSRQGLADYRTLRNVLDAMVATSEPDSTPTAPVPVAVSAVQAPTATMTGPTSVQAFVRPPKEFVEAKREWPAIVLSHLGNGSANVASEGYRNALHSNLRAMIGCQTAEAKRRAIQSDLASSSTSLPTTQECELANRIALAADAQAATIRALSDRLLLDAEWRLCNDRQGESGFVRLQSPTWIAGGGGDVAAVMLHDSKDCATIAIAPAGAAMPTAVVHRLTLLVVGGLRHAGHTNGSAQNSHSQSAKLSDWIANQSAKWSLDECVREVSRLRLSGDWWMMFVDAVTQRQAVVESRDGMLVIERGQVATARLDETQQLMTAPAVTIDFDSAARRFTLRHRGADVRAKCNDLLLNESWLESVRPHHQAAVHAVEAQPARSGIASRYELQMSPAPQRITNQRQPEWSGAALVVGDNPVAKQLESTLRAAGVSVTRLSASEDPQWLATQLVELSKVELVKHLFIATPCDADAQISLDERQWTTRRNKGIMGIFWLCQRWLNQIVSANCADDASLVAISAQGGDFGFSGNIQSAEGGGIGGLLKSILIEGWMQGIRTLPIKVIDTSVHQTPAEVVDCVWRELAVPSYDLEVAYIRGVRHVVRAIPRAVEASGKSVARGGTWVCTGGARGITAFVAEELAKRFGLKLHLLGTAPVPQFDPSWRDLDEAGTRRLKAHVMTSARDAGLNPVKSWQNTEKALEIDATLRRFAALGIEAHYHCCDVADRVQLNATLNEVRRRSGPIEGVLHGAGVGKDARFDRKQADKVNQCIAAKVDGSLALMAATQSDPLKYFVGFGSISGRFGANGHTDYSLSNEMLCKQIDWFKRQRPEVKAIGFHWHAWGDVGMATKPETRLALEMIDMQFMPAQEGMQHLIAELEGDSDATEVLITDDKYYRAFYPAETLVSSVAGTESAVVRTPMLTADAVTTAGEWRFTAKVDPARDPFLAEHKLDGAPLLPFVAAAEMLLEAASSCSPGQRVVLQDIEAVQGLRFFSPAQRDIKVVANRFSDQSFGLRLQCDFLSRDGRLVEADRVHFRATATTKGITSERVLLKASHASVWNRSIYPSADAKFHVGWPFQRLRKFTLMDDGLIGKIAAPALIELAGAVRDLRGWQIPCAAMDSCLFAVGMLAWQRVAAGTALPVRFGRLEVGRLPSPGEACEVHTRLLSHSSGRACFDFTLYGVDGEVLLNATDYEVAWLQASGQSESVMPAVRGAN